MINRYLMPIYQKVEQMTEFWRSLSTIARIGVVIIALSIPLFLALPVIPFLPLTAGAKGITAGVVFVAAEVMFYGGALLAGKDVVVQLKSLFSKKSPPSSKG